jgi:hypothetical protein
MTMKRLLGLLLFLIPMIAVGQSGVDGTWRIDLNKTQLDSKPRVFELKDGMYSCSTCDPKITTKADGQDHQVTGSPYIDTANVTVVDENTVDVVGKKNGKVTFRAAMTISPDGKTLTRNFEEHPIGSDQVMTTTALFSRVGEPEAGAHLLSGSWKREKIEASENWLVFTYASTGDGLNYKASNGEAYHAKFDGKDYPYQGDPGTTSVVLKKIDDHTFEETDKRDGKVVAVSRLSISPDGKSLTMVSQDKLRGSTDTFVAEKLERQDAEK